MLELAIETKGTGGDPTSIPCHPLLGRLSWSLAADGCAISFAGCRNSTGDFQPVKPEEDAWGKEPGWVNG